MGLSLYCKLRFSLYDSLHVNILDFVCGVSRIPEAVQLILSKTLHSTDLEERVLPRSNCNVVDAE